MKKYSRVSYETRCQIFAFLQANFSVSYISKELGFHRSTIYREIKRNTFGGPYRVHRAQKFADDRFKRCRRKRIIHGETEELIWEKINQYWTPEQIAGRAKREKKLSISHETIYRYIRRTKPLAKKLPYLLKSGMGRIGQKRKVRKGFTSIHKRPKIVNERKRFGDWERDGMYGSNRKQILVCTERKSRYTKLGMMKSAHSDHVNELTKKLLKETGKKVFSITNDNGAEFRRPIGDKIKTYRCDPMKPQQRGTVENTVGLLRKQIKRNTDLELLGEKKLKEIEKSFNLIPRKILDYRSPYEVMFKKNVALVM